MRFILITILLSVVSSPGIGQFKTIAQGQSFEEPGEGYAKLLLMKNGNTIYLHIDLKEGMEVTVYDPSHHVKASRNLLTKYGHSKYKSIESVFEVNGDVVIMIGEAEDSKPTLARIILDGNTGAIKKEEKIAELLKIGFFQDYALSFGHVPKPDFFIRKDPHTDYYAVAMLNSFESDRNKRIEILYYGPDHREISRAYYRSPDNRYKYLDYLDMVVIGQERVSVLAYAYNTAASGGKESELVLANMTPGTKEVTLDDLPFSKDLIFHYGLTRYNTVTKSILLLAAVQVSKKSNEYGTVIAFIDPFERKVVNGRTIYPEKVNSESEALFGRKGGYNGVPQNLFVNSDGSFSIAFEEIRNITRVGADYTYSESELGNIAVCKYDPSGNELQSYFIPKQHLVYGYYLHPFYHSKREGTTTELKKANQYKSFAYLEGKGKSYILFNDIEKNGESAKKGKTTVIQAVKECDGFYFSLNDNDILPQRQFVFGKPDEKKEHDLALFAISDFDREHNIYCTLKLEKEGRSKQVKVVWLDPR